MTLSEFRRLTSHLSGDRQILCAGAAVRLVWHDADMVSIDDSPWVDTTDAHVLFLDDAPSPSTV